MQFILFSSPKNIPDEAAIVAAAFELGLPLFHLRKKEMPLEMIRAFLLFIPKKFHPQIVLHAQYQLTDEFDLKGIHLTEKKRKEWKEGQFVLKKKPISTSFHSLEDWRREQKKCNFEYSFLSPIFDSISKKNHSAAFDLEELSRILKIEKKRPTIALGGIDATNFEQTKILGFDGAAVLGTVWQSSEPLSVLKQLLAI